MSKIILVPIDLRDNSLEDYGIQGEVERSTIAIDLTKVEAMYPSKNSKTNEDITILNMSSGVENHVYAEFDTILKKWMNA